MTDVNPEIVPEGKKTALPLFVELGMVQIIVARDTHYLLYPDGPKLYTIKNPAFLPNTISAGYTENRNLSYNFSRAIEQIIERWICVIRGINDFGKYLNLLKVFHDHLEHIHIDWNIETPQDCEAILALLYCIQELLERGEELSFISQNTGGETQRNYNSLLILRKSIHAAAATMYGLSPELLRQENIVDNPSYNQNERAEYQKRIYKLINLLRTSHLPSWLSIVNGNLLKLIQELESMRVRESDPVSERR